MKKTEEELKKEKEEARNKASNLKKWYEFSPALGGSWLKASTEPPKYDDPLHILLIRDGCVMDVIKTSVSRYCCGWITPEYRSSARGPGWGIEKPSHSFSKLTGLFPNAVIGDCAMVQIQPVKEDKGSQHNVCKMPAGSIQG